LTRMKQRVFVIAAAENDEAESWFFSIKPKSYEMLVLLCWGRDFLIHDFVVPQKLYVTPWTAAKKAAGKEALTFSVAKEGDRYMLYLPHAAAIDITDTAASYAIIGG
jgi:tryptophanyl-tRNA synthetase